jgi:hypothetical protein
MQRSIKANISMYITIFNQSIFNYNKAIQKYKQSPECPICLEYNNNSIKILRRCKHIFCSSCHDKWFSSQQRNCALCRTPLPFFDNSDWSYFETTELHSINLLELNLNYDDIDLSNPSIDGFDLTSQNQYIDFDIQCQFLNTSILGGKRKASPSSNNSRVKKRKINQLPPYFVCLNLLQNIKQRILNFSGLSSDPQSGWCRSIPDIFLLENFTALKVFKEKQEIETKKWPMNFVNINNINSIDY